MSRSITVYTKSDLQFASNPPDVDVLPAEFDQWRDEVNSRCLYEAPLGSESVVCENWSQPAVKLGLSFLASICEKGFYEGIAWSGQQLYEVERELPQLELYWWQHYQNELTLLQRLFKGSKDLQNAIEIARACDGILSID